MKRIYEIGKRKCYICKEIKNLNTDNFYETRYNSLGFRSECKKCNKRSSVRYDLITNKKFTCEKCGLKKEGLFSFFDIDHIEPIKRKAAGTTYYSKKDISNYMVLCPNCHRMKTILNKENRSK